MKSTPPRVAAVVLIGCLIPMLSGCMPMIGDDFSEIGHDEFSKLVRDSYSDVNLTPGHSYGINGVGALDRKKAKSLATNVFARKGKIDVINLFRRYGGKCESTNEREILRCEFTRNWKYKNVGAPIDLSNWPKPTARLDFVFNFDKLDQVDRFDLSIIDVTEYKNAKDTK
jgi:hypothetical protein